MEIKGLNLDSAPLISENKSLRFAKNISVHSSLQSYINEAGFKPIGNIYSNTTDILCGIITTNIGFVAFIKRNTLGYINYYEVTNDKVVLKKSIYAYNLNFDENRPITGDYTYNYKNELIITFTEGISEEANETRIININNPTSRVESSEIHVQLNTSEVSLLNIIPDVTYPTLNFRVLNSGSLKAGAYQVAIKYCLEDGTYTNYSILHRSIIISGNYLDSVKVGDYVTKSIEVKFANVEIKYKYYKLAIVYIDEESQLAYETDNIKLEGNNTYIISNLENNTSISLEDIFVNKIGYIKDTCHVNFNNRLLRGNVKTIDYSSLDNILKNAANNAKVDLISYNKQSELDKSTTSTDVEDYNTPYYMGYEVYSIYIGFFDYKGSLINIYKCPYKEGDATTNFNTNHLIPYSDRDVVYRLSVSFPTNIISTIPNTVKSFCVFNVEHNFNNSRILSQAIALRDTDINIFSNGQKYSGQFDSETKVRIYPFEFLFNNKESISANILTYAQIDDTHISHDGNNLPDEYKCVTDTEVATSSMNLNLNDLYTTGIIGDTRQDKLEYIAANNSQVDNIAGDSYYRVVHNNAVEGSNWLTGTNKFALILLANTTDNLYVDEYNQTLQIASSIYPINKNANAICYGDTRISYLTLRATTPGTGFKIGGTSEEQSNAHVWRWIFTVPIESKFNIRARYDITTVDKAYKLHYATDIKDLYPLYGLSYEVDNAINTSIGKGYSLIFNENGIQDYVYWDKIPGIFEYPSRIIRSDILNPESEILSWRYYNANEYNDLPNNREGIVSLKTDNKNLYIQQRYGLRLAKLRDTLSVTGDGTSYLGSTDIFNIEPYEILYSPSGYIGCINSFDTAINVAGYFVYDNDKGKLFNIFGDSVSEISNINTKEWFYKNKSNDYINNPFIHNGRYFNYNEDTNVLTFVNNKDNNKFTISFNNNVKKWISFHDYIPLYGLTNRLGTIWIFDDSKIINSIYKVDENIKGYFNDKYYPSTIKILFNENPIINKELQNILWKDRVTYIDDNSKLKVILWDKTIDNIFVHNDTQCSDIKVVKFNKEWYNGNTGVNKINIWRFNDIKDYAKTPNFLANEISIKDNALHTNLKWYNRNEIVSQFVYVIMTFNNTSNNYEYELQEADAQWIVDNRNN